MKRISMVMMMLILVFGLTLSAHATLIVRGTDTRGNQLIYDSDLNITWYDFLADLNNWSGQNDWAHSLTVDFNGTIYDDWRLPQSNIYPNGAFNDTGSEMGHLYYTELGNSAGGPLSTGFIDGLTGDSEAFMHLTPHLVWSESRSSLSAMYFHFNTGFEDLVYMSYNFFGLAVRPGDVAAVPEPGTVFLLGSGLAGLVAFRKRLGRIHR